MHVGVFAIQTLGNVPVRPKQAQQPRDPWIPLQSRPLCHFKTSVYVNPRLADIYDYGLHVFDGLFQCVFQYIILPVCCVYVRYSVHRYVCM